MRRVSRLEACALGVAFVLLGCESTCPRETVKEPTPYEDGNTNSQGTIYETNAWDEPFVHFPAGRRVALQHGLVEIPVAIRSYLAFKEYPFPADESEPGFVAESAGNQVLIERVDDEVIRVRNDTCEEFWLRVVASTDEDAGETNAGGSGGANHSGGAGGAAPDDLAGAGGR